MKITNQINDNIFRDYDIRGIYGTDLNDDIAYTIGKTFGTKLRNENKTDTIIGYDNRSSSLPLFNALAQGIVDTGINVINLGLVTTPMYYYALTLFGSGSGIMITASHNPREYNGFKISFNGIYNAYGSAIQEFKNSMRIPKYVFGKGEIKYEDIKERYVNYITSSINLTNPKPKVVIDCGNGTGSVIIKDVMQKLNMHYIPIYCDSNPAFPNHHPDPSIEANLTDLKKAVLDTKAILGISIDGDADRLGVVDENGNMINIDQLMIIFLRDIMPTLKNKNIVYDVKCSKALEDEIIKLGGNPICYRTGNSYMRAKLVDDNLSFVGELSGHVFFNDKFDGFDDGIYNALRLVEILNKTNKKPSELLVGINKYYSTREGKITVTDDNKFKIVDEVISYANNKGYTSLTIDGIRVKFEDGFALVRASNTGPNITTRFEATTENRLQEIKTEFETLLDYIKSKY